MTRTTNAAPERGSAGSDLGIVDTADRVAHIWSFFRHDKKENNQLSPVKKRVKENTPSHQQQHYNQQQQQGRGAHICQLYHASGHYDSEDEAPDVKSFKQQVATSVECPRRTSVGGRFRQITDFRKQFVSTFAVSAQLAAATATSATGPHQRD